MSTPSENEEDDWCLGTETRIQDGCIRCSDPMVDAKAASPLAPPSDESMSTSDISSTESMEESIKTASSDQLPRFLPGVCSGNIGASCDLHGKSPLGFEARKTHKHSIFDRQLEFESDEEFQGNFVCSSSPPLGAFGIKVPGERASPTVWDASSTPRSPQPVNNFTAASSNDKVGQWLDIQSHASYGDERILPWGATNAKGLKEMKEAKKTKESVNQQHPSKILEAEHLQGSSDPKYPKTRNSGKSDDDDDDDDDDSAQTNPNRTQKQ